MATEHDKTQIGIRLPSDLVRLIDAMRGNRSRAEYCRELIEKGLAATQTTGSGMPERLTEMLCTLQEHISSIRHSTVLAEGDTKRTHTEIQRLRVDFATAIVGVLTKLGQVVRDEDKRRFARAKAESFAARVLLTNAQLKKETS